MFVTCHRYLLFHKKIHLNLFKQEVKEKKKKPTLSISMQSFILLTCHNKKAQIADGSSQKKQYSSLKCESKQTSNK